MGELNENWRWRCSSWDSFACGSSCCRQKLKLLDVLVVGVAIVVLSLWASPTSVPPTLHTSASASCRECCVGQCGLEGQGRTLSCEWPRPTLKLLPP